MSFIHSIKFRFTIWYLIVLAILLILLSTSVYFYLSREMHQNLDYSLQRRALEVQGMGGILSIMEQGEFQEELGETVSLFLNYEGDLIELSGGSRDMPIDNDLLEKAFAGESVFSTVDTSNNEHLRLYAAPFTPEGPIVMRGRRHMSAAEVIAGPAVLVTARSTSNIEQALDQLLRTLIIAVPVTMIVAGLGGVFLAKRALSPVDRITLTAHQIEEGGDLSQRIDVSTKDELGRLAATLNRMINRIEKSFDTQRRFTGDASHELRTPLSVIQAESSLALQKERSASEYRESLEMISQEAISMSATINQLLTLARADAGKEQLSLAKFEMSELIAELVSNVAVLCQDKGLKFQMSPMESTRVTGDRLRLKGMFLSLLDNAIKYTPSGGTVSVSLAKDGNTAVVAIADNGIGISPEHLPHIFERFYRVDKARSREEGGSGLGLAICRHIAKIHGGSITVSSAIGKGSTFRVSLPI